MRLYLVQHGDAVGKEVDPDRPLSETGRRDVDRLAAFLAERNIGAARVLHSGKTRARETAEILAQAMAPGAQVEASRGLDPNDPTDTLAREVSGWADDALVVGHLPFMDRFVARLTTGDEEVSVAAFRPGSLVCLERGQAGRWVIAWMIRPELLQP
ncbi:MAG: phosphohistidine phosphatase SixA [Kiloniellales bacterium]